MRIAFNTLSENPLKPSGSLDFFVQMTRMLVDTDRDNRYFVFCSQSNKHLFQKLQGRATIVVAGRSNEHRWLRILSEQMLVPFLLKKYRINIYFTSSGGGAVPILAPKSIKIVSAVYGTHHLKDGINVGFARKNYRSFMTKASVKKASVVVVNSDSCKQDVMESLHVPEVKVRRIFHGIDLCRFHSGDLDEKEKKLLASRNVRQPFLLFVSVIWFYKNAHTLVEAFGKLVSRKRISDAVELVMIGEFDRSSGLSSDQNYKEMLNKIADVYGVRERIKYIGFVPNDQMRPFYKSAEAYIQPSFHETFGKTVVEAMACGCPVIGADNSSTSEILSDYGLLFPSKDSDQLADHIERLLLSQSLREELKGKALKRAKMFDAQTETLRFISLFNELRG